MSSNSQFSDAAVNAEANALGPLANSGVLKIYAGSQPANANTAIGAQTVLATHTLNATAFGSAVAGLITAGVIAAVAIAATGVANFFRVFKADGTTVLFDGTISNQTVTLSAPAALSAVSLAVTALSLPLYAGQDLWFTDGGVLKKASVTVNAASGAVAVTVSALAAAIASGATAVGNLVVGSPNYQQNAQSAISAMTVQVSEQGQ